jgi:GNAT superfamily N-acetyltransferase
MSDAIRIATAEDVERVTDTIALAFRTDPIWSVALSTIDGSDLHRDFWRFYVEGALHYSTVFLIQEEAPSIAAAVAVWIPPGGEEMAESQDAALRRLAAERLSPRSSAALEQLWERFETNHPHDPPHAYLSLLATHPSRRGHGMAQGLLAENLNRWDELGVPSYLESTNPDNDHRYARRGFRPIGGFRAVLDDAAVTTMWRAVPEL